MTTRRPRDPQQEPARTRISGPAELARAVPYMLGFHPRRSLVLVGLLDDGGHRVTARYDLADLVPEPFAPLTPDGAVMVAMVADRFAGGGVESVVALIFDDTVCAEGRIRRDPDGRLPYDMIAVALPELIATAESAEAPDGLWLLDTILVGEQRWWSFDCPDPGCCPPDGSPLPDVPSEYAADAVFRGVVPLSDRESLARQLEPHDSREALRDRVVAVAKEAAQAASDGDDSRRRRSAVRALFAAARASTDPMWIPPDDAETARHVAALGSVQVRDAVWMGVESGRIDGRPLWRHLARSAPEPFDATPLFLYGWTCWRDGDGASAAIAAQRAVVSDPRCSAADLLLAALSRGVDPRTFPRLRRSA